MTITVTFAWWWIPAAITVAGLVWALFIVKDEGGYLGGLSRLLAAGAAMAASAVAWAVAGFLK